MESTHIDVRLSSELVEDNVGPRAKHVIPCGPDEHRSGIRVEHDVWSRRGNHTQETTEPPREIECLECEDKSDSPLEEDTEQFLRAKIESSLWRLLSRIAVRRSPILRRGWMRSASEGDAKEHQDWTDLESDLVQRGAGGPQVKTTNRKTL